VLTLLLLAVAGWTPSPSPCTESALVRRQVYVNAVRNRKPGNLFYAEIPFPQSDDDVLADFKAAIRTRDASCVTDPSIADGVLRDAYRYEIVRVTNWVVDDCHEFGNAFFVLRVFNRVDGKEVTRVLIDESGAIGCSAARPDEMPSIPTIANADRILANAHIRAAGAEYVSISRPWHDLPLAPPHLSVAYRNSDGIYVVAEDGLWFLPKDGERLSWRAILNEDDLLKVLESYPPDAGPFSISSGQFVIALPVRPSSGLH